MKLANRLSLTVYKLIALFILKMTYNKALELLFGLLGLFFLALFLTGLNFISALLSILFLIPLLDVFLMKPFDDIIVISRVTGSPHVLIRNKKVIIDCFRDGKLDNTKLIKVIKQSMNRYLYECALHTKRTYITSYTHKVMFRALGLDKLDFIRDAREIRPGIIRDKLLFVSFRDIWSKDDIKNLAKKVPYYKFKIDINLLREYLNR